MKKQLILFTVMLIFSTALLSAEERACYVVVENPGSYDELAVTSISLTMIRQFVDSGVKPFPTEGISEKECMYRVNISENGDGLKVFIFGNKISDYGTSNLRGEPGLEQGVLRAIYKSLRNNSKEAIAMCQSYGTALEKECQQIPSQQPSTTESQPQVQVQLPQQDNQAQQPLMSHDLPQNQCTLQMGAQQSQNRRRPPQNQGRHQKAGIRQTGQGPSLSEYRHSSPEFAVCYPTHWKDPVKKMGKNTVFSISGGQGRLSMAVIVGEAKPGLRLGKNLIKRLERVWRRTPDIKRIKVERSEKTNLLDGSRTFLVELKVSFNNRKPLVSANAISIKDNRIILVSVWGPDGVPGHILKNLAMTLQLKP